MSTIEDRLGAALAARADLVQPEDLRETGAPVPRSTLNRPVTWLLAAAACAAVIAVPFVVSGAGDDAPSPPPATQTPKSTPTPAPAVEGADWPQVAASNKYDVDGDGQSDRVVTRTETGENLTQDPWRIEAQLSSGGVAAVLLSGEGWENGLVKPIDGDGDGGDEIVIYRGTETDEIGVLDLADDGNLVDLGVPPSPGITSQIDGQGRLHAWWIEDRTLYSTRSVEGGFEPGDGTKPVPGTYPVELVAWQVVDGALVPDDRGLQCVHQGLEARGARCAGTSEDGAVVGTVGPGESFETDIDGGSDDTLGLEGSVDGPSVAAGDIELVATTTNGGEARAPIPAGGVPSVFTTLLVGIETPAIVVSQPKGEGTRLTVFEFWNGELVVARVESDVPLGSGARSDGSRYVTRLTEDGRLLTTVTDASGEQQQWLWRQNGDALAADPV